MSGTQGLLDEDLTDLGFIILTGRQLINIRNSICRAVLCLGATGSTLPGPLFDLNRDP